jgi:hypothetical protein
VSAPKRKSLGLQLIDVGADRAKRIRAPTVNFDFDWEDVDLSINSYKLIESPNVQVHAKCSLPQTSTLCQIFCQFVTVDICRRVFDAIPKESLYYGSTNRSKLYNKGHYNPKHIFQMLAIQIHITGLQNCPRESSGIERPLRDAIMDAKKHFDDMFPEEPSQY